MCLSHHQAPTLIDFVLRSTSGDRKLALQGGHHETWRRRGRALSSDWQCNEGLKLIKLFHCCTHEWPAKAELNICCNLDGNTLEAASRQTPRKGFLGASTRQISSRNVRRAKGKLARTEKFYIPLSIFEVVEWNYFYSFVRIIIGFSNLWLYFSSESHFSFSSLSSPSPSLLLLLYLHVLSH